jgi:hypothetical protein
MVRILLCLLAAGTLLPGQMTTGTITGLVTDPSQGRVAKAKLRLTNEATGVQTSAEANEQGEYTFPLLNSGTYRLVAEAPGFQGYSRTGLVVELGRTARLDVTLSIGQVSDVINVTGAAPLLESETSTVSQLIEQKTIADMPLNGRRVGELLAMTGAAVFVQGDVIRPRVSMSGGRADQQQWILDGVNASNVALEVPQALFNPPVESVQEIRVQANGYSAEFGNSSGGVVATTTKSGTNTLKGTLYENFRNQKMDARNFFAASRPPLRWNVFGFAVGGPVVMPKLYNGRNRTFFFSNVEWQKQRIGNVRIFNMPTALEKTGNFSQTTNATGVPITIIDPASSPRVAFPSNIIPSSRLDPVGQRIAALYPDPNRTPTNRAGANNFGANGVTALDLTTWTSKIDHNISDKDRVWVRYVLHNFPTKTSTVFPEPAADPNGVINLRRAHSIVVSEIHTFSPALINDVRFNWQPRFFNALSLGLDEGWPDKLGLKGVSPRAYPRVNVNGYASQGSGTHERIQAPIQDAHLVDVLSWFKGAHSVKFGGEWRFGRNAENFSPSMSGVFVFAPQPTAIAGNANSGNGVASLLLGLPNSASVVVNDRLDRRSHYLAGFVQDDWKVSANFTLNAGVRWEVHTPRIDAKNRQSSFDLKTVNPASGTPGAVTFANQGGLGRTIYNGDWNNFAPRLGFAWKPFGSRKTVIRSSYGIFYGVPLPGSNNLAAGFSTQGDFQTPDNGITPPFLLRNGVPAIPKPATLDASFGAVAVGQAVRFAPSFLEINRTLGYTQQWNFNIQRELVGNLLLETGYLGTVGHRLNGPDTSINQVRPELMAAGNAQIRRPFPQFGNVTIVAPMWGNSNYHAFNAKLEKRFSGGLNFLANYTFAKFIDDVPANFENGSVPGGIQNFYDRRAERALSGNDVRNRLVASGVWETPFGRGRRFGAMGPVSWLGGWNLGGILTLQAGSPVGATVQTNSTNAFNPGALRANILRDPNLPGDQRRLDRWFDTSAFALPAPFTFGTASRAVTTGPGIVNLDLSLLKNFAWGERYNVQFRFESFNIANRANFEEPGIALGAPTFGVISVAKSARSIQLGLKLTF